MQMIKRKKKVKNKSFCETRKKMWGEGKEKVSELLASHQPFGQDSKQQGHQQVKKKKNKNKNKILIRWMFSL